MNEWWRGCFPHEVPVFLCGQLWKPAFGWRELPGGASDPGWGCREDVGGRHLPPVPTLPGRAPLRLGKEGARARGPGPRDPRGARSPGPSGRGLGGRGVLGSRCDLRGLTPGPRSAPALAGLSFPRQPHLPLLRG